MAITPDQQATLQLLLERGQSYGDLAKLLGQDEADVRARARAALTEIGGADPDRNVGLTDYILGQADPIGRADASRHLRDDPADHALATELCETLRSMYPAAELPRLPGEPRGARRKPKRPATGEAPARKSPLAGLDQSQTRLVAIAGGAAVLLLVVVLAIAGVFGGGDDGDASTASADTSTTADAPADEQVQQVPLEPVGGGDARGEAIFGLASGDQPFVDVAIEGLDPAPNDDTYVIWLMLNETEGYPLSPITVSGDGSFSDRFAIPAAVLSLVARIQAVDVSIAPINTVRKLVRDALEESALVLEEPGEVVLQGQIPASGQAAGGGSGSDSGSGSGEGSGGGN